MRVECAVVGAGVIGLAVARQLALDGREVVILEAAGTIGAGTSSRSSEVIHAGIYYPTGSLKAQLCVKGRRRLYAYCADRGVHAEAIGKLVVATTESQLEQLAALHRLAIANGVEDLEPWSAEAVRSVEPQVRCAGALFSPSTGIIDSHGLMLAFQADLEAAGGFVALRTPMEAAAVTDEGFRLEIGGADPSSLSCSKLVNAAGLDAVALARRIGGAAARSAPRQYLAKGHYFSLSGGRRPFRHLVYPIPEPGGLGIHATMDLGGQVRFGPDVHWVDRVDYSVDEGLAERFYTAIRHYWPALPDGALQPAYAGVRPKLSGPGEPPADFLIQAPEHCGVPGLVNLYGIESPGLTASLAIAAVVADALR